MAEIKPLPLIIGAVALAGGVFTIYYLLKKKLKVSITASPTSGNAPLTVNFTSTAENGKEPYSYAWNFGDETTSTLQNPSHTYQTAGDYTANVTVTDAEGKQVSKSIMIAVTGVIPPPPPPGEVTAIIESFNLIK